MQNSKLASKKSRPTAQTVVPNANANANAAEDPQVSGGSRAQQVPSSGSNTDTAADTIPRGGQGSTKFKSKISRETPSSQAATSQSLPPTDVSGSANGNATTRNVRGIANV
jgi:hypothetical protein